MKSITPKTIGILLLFLFISSSLFSAKKLPKKKVANLPKSEKLVYPTTLSVTDKVFGLSKVWSEVKYNFVNIDQLNFDLDSLYNQTIYKVMNTNNDEEYYDVIQNFLATMNDGHTELSGRPYSWNIYNDYIPMMIEEVDKHFYFTSIRKGHTSLDSTAIGAEVIEIEGIPVQDYVIKNYFPKISASTETSRWMMAAYKMMQGEKGSSFIGKARKLNGEIFMFSILKNGETTRTPEDQYYGYSKPRKDWVDLSWKSDIAILELNSFSKEEINKKIDDAAEQINSKAKGLIIDLRRNGGGITPVANHLLKYIVKSNYFLKFGAQRRINDSYGRAQGNYRDEYKDFYTGKAYRTDKADTVFVEPTINKFKCPIIILISNYTFSAAEDFLINLYEIPGRPLLMGQATGGSTGAPLFFYFLKDASVRICSVRMTYPYSGKPFVGEGIKPDITVYPVVSDLIKGGDYILEVALNKMKTLTK